MAGKTLLTSILMAGMVLFVLGHPSQITEAELKESANEFKEALLEQTAVQSEMASYGRNLNLTKLQLNTTLAGAPQDNVSFNFIPLGAFLIATAAKFANATSSLTG